MTIHVPALGWCVFALAGLCFFLPARWMLGLAFLLAPLKASSVLDFGFGGRADNGLQAGYFAAIAFMAKLVLDALRGRGLRLSSEVRRLFLYLGLFTVLAAGSAAVYPFVFRGQVDVLPITAGFDPIGIRPLRPVGTNFVQSGYLIVSVLFAFAVACFVAARRSWRFAANAYLLSGLFVVCMGLYQVVSFYAGLPFPYDFFINNPAYGVGAVNSSQQAGLGIKRLSSVLTEPSAAAHWLCGLAAFALVAYQQKVYGQFALWLGMAALFSVLISTSTTGYVTLAALIGLMSLKAAGHVLVAGYTVHRRTLHISLITTVMVCAGVAALVGTGLLDLLIAAAERFLIYKLSSVSADLRIGGDLFALEVFASTWGLGAGWGSNRASSQFTRVLSTVGIAGILLLLAFAWRLFLSYRRLLRQARRGAPAGDEALTGQMKAHAWSIGAMTIAALVAAGDPAALATWIGLGLMIGVMASLRERLQTSAGGPPQKGTNDVIDG